MMKNNKFLGFNIIITSISLLFIIFGLIGTFTYDPSKLKDIKEVTGIIEEYKQRDGKWYDVKTLTDCKVGDVDPFKSLRNEVEDPEGSTMEYEFTVEGKKLDSYMADVDTDEAYTPDTEVVADGYFHESEFRSAPYFDIQLDGITLLNSMF